MGVLSSDRNATRPKALFEFTQGIAQDSRLFDQETRVQAAWARALARAGILTKDESDRACAALDVAIALKREGKFEWRVEDEDVHMNLERFVTEREGELGKRMHLGRSRNDLIATTLRLYVADMLDGSIAATGALIESLLERAEKDIEILVPGMTHLQNGQPVRYSHILTAHAWAFLRDIERMTLARSRALASMPLGSAALAGTTLSLDLQTIADELGFQSPTFNSYDSVGDRDFMVEAIDALASLGLHLSRISEDVIYWSSSPVALVRLPKAWSTGSSIMPNKRNPDVPELTRAKAAHLIGCAANAHALIKGLPTSYDSDLHELKQVLIRAVDESQACLAVLPEFFRGLEPDAARAAQLLQRGHVLATEIADMLAFRGVPFREAYKQVAALVERAESLGVQVHELKSEQAAACAPDLEPGALSALSARAAIERRQNSGGTSLARVRDGIEELRERLKRHVS